MTEFAHLHTFNISRNEFATINSYLFFFSVFSCQIAFLSGLFPIPSTLPFVALGSAKAHLLPLPPGLLILPPVPFSFRGKSIPRAWFLQGQSISLDADPPWSWGGTGWSYHSHPSSHGAKSSSRPRELIHSTSSLRVWWEETFCKSKK